MKRAGLLIMALALLGFTFACTGRKAPQPATSSSSISMNGGASISGTGGDPGWFYGYTSGAPIVVNSSGTVDAGFTLPTYTANYGANEAKIKTNTTVQLDQNNVVGGLFMVNTTSDPSCQIYVGDGSGVAAVANGTAVTGLLVDAGATLTLPSNNGSNSTTYVDGDITINGIVNTTAAGELDIESYNNSTNYGTNVTIGSTGEVDGTVAGAAGRSIYLYGGTVLNEGTINVNGAAGQSGGYADLESASYTVNTVTIEANGGNGTTGGDDSYEGVDLESDYGNVYNSGYLLAMGGDGSDGNGGTGGQVYMYGCDSDNYNGLQGDVLASGLIDVSGGNGTNGNGGYGGYVEFDTYAQGKMNITAQINGNGGSSTGSSYEGAGANEVGFYSDGEDEDYPVSSVGAVQVASQINLNGGSGDGNALNDDAGIWFETENYLYDNGSYDSVGVSAPITFYTTSTMTMNGGKGYTGGGNADNGGVYLWTDSPVDANGNNLPAGSITFQTEVYNQGGAVTDTAVGSGYYGGSGGYVDIEAGNYYDQSSINTWLYGPANVTNSATTVTGNMHLGGGAGDIGGSGIGAYIYGQTVTNSGNINADGGNGLTTGGNGPVGEDSIDLYSILLNTTNTGTLSVAGGTGGTTNGTAGNIYIDGVLQ